MQYAKAYPNVITIDDSTGIFDKDGKEVTVEKSLVDAARVELDKLNYQYERELEYPDIGTQTRLHLSQRNRKMEDRYSRSC